MSLRRSRMLVACSATRFKATTVGPLTLHLARASGLENAGIHLHPIYGFASLPSSGLKGDGSRVRRNGLVCGPRRQDSGLAAHPDGVRLRAGGGERQDMEAGGCGRSAGITGRRDRLPRRLAKGVATPAAGHREQPSQEVLRWRGRSRRLGKPRSRSTSSPWRRVRRSISPCRCGPPRAVMVRARSLWPWPANGSRRRWCTRARAPRPTPATAASGWTTWRNPPRHTRGGAAYREPHAQAGNARLSRRGKTGARGLRPATRHPARTAPLVVADDACRPSRSQGSPPPGDGHLGRRRERRSARDVGAV